MLKNERISKALHACLVRRAGASGSCVCDFDSEPTTYGIFAIGRRSPISVASSTNRGLKRMTFFVSNCQARADSIMLPAALQRSDHRTSKNPDVRLLFQHGIEDRTPTPGSKHKGET